MPSTYVPGAWRRTRSQLGVTARRDPQADLDHLRRRLRVQHLADRVNELAPLSTAERALIASAGAGPAMTVTYSSYRCPRCGRSRRTSGSAIPSMCPVCRIDQQQQDNRGGAR